MNTELLRWLALRSPEGESAAADGGAETGAGAPVGEGSAPDGTDDSAGGDGGDSDGGAATTQTPPQQAGLVARVGQLTRQKRELEERLAAYEASQRQAAPVDPAELDPETARRTIDLEINRRAALMAQQEDWRRTADRVWNEGLSKHGDWAQQINGLAGVLGEIPRSLTEAAIETGAPVDVLYELARNPDQALSIAALPAAKQGVALAKIANGISGQKPAPRVSGAPAPVTPRVAGGGANSPARTLDDPNLSMEDWARLRNEQIKARRGR